MNRKAVAYEVLKYDNTYDLTAQVKKYISYGYEPCGGLAVVVVLDHIQFIQAMVKYELV